MAARHSISTRKPQASRSKSTSTPRRATACSPRAIPSKPSDCWRWLNKMSTIAGCVTSGWPGRMNPMAPDLSTTYLGLQLSSPLVPSASPLSRNLDTIRRMEDAGAAAIVLHSLFEEQIEFESHILDRYLNVSADSSYWEATSYHPEPDDFRLAPDEYLEHLRRAKAAAGIPIIASLNGISSGGWIKYAHLIEQAGADALELNVYYMPTDQRLAGARIEESTLELVRQVRASISIPLAVKLSPFYSSIAHVAHELDKIGVDGLVL